MRRGGQQSWLRHKRRQKHIYRNTWASLSFSPCFQLVCHCFFLSWNCHLLFLTSFTFPHLSLLFVQICLFSFYLYVFFFSLLFPSAVWLENGPVITNWTLWNMTEGSEIQIIDPTTGRRPLYPMVAAHIWVVIRNKILHGHGVTQEVLSLQTRQNAEHTVYTDLKVFYSKTLLDLHWKLPILNYCGRNLKMSTIWFESPTFLLMLYGSAAMMSLCWISALSLQSGLCSNNS